MNHAPEFRHAHTRTPGPLTPERRAEPAAFPQGFRGLMWGLLLVAPLWLLFLLVLFVLSYAIGAGWR